MNARGRCVGCQEAEATTKIDGLGGVCESCAEVPEIVIETEIERVRNATAIVYRVIDDLDREVARPR